MGGVGARGGGGGGNLGSGGVIILGPPVSEAGSERREDAKRGVGRGKEEVERKGEKESKGKQATKEKDEEEEGEWSRSDTVVLTAAERKALDPVRSMCSPPSSISIIHQHRHHHHHTHTVTQVRWRSVYTSLACPLCCVFICR